MVKNKGVTKQTGYTLNIRKGRYKIMMNKEIFEILADHEEKLFYALCNDSENKPLRQAHENAKRSLEAFALATGCHN